MKTFPALIVIFLLTLLGTTSLLAQDMDQDSTGLPGDNFSLAGALQLFQNAASPEEFEKALNTEDNHVNNLDLNGDGDIDYVRVVDQVDGDAHAFILQVPVSDNENQDIAVIELEKNGDASAMVQIVGDEDIYGEEMIVEPNGDEDQMDAPKGKGPAPDNAGLSAAIVVNVWGWPCVRYVYAPVYRPWVSPWRWHYYPTWWRPWRPLTWRVWHPFYRPYHRHFVVVHTHRTVHARRVYVPHRTTSVTVTRRHGATVGQYRVNHTRTKVTGPRGNTTTVKKTTVRGPKGHVRGTKTTVTRKKGRH